MKFGFEANINIDLKNCKIIHLYNNIQILNGYLPQFVLFALISSSLRFRFAFVHNTCDVSYASMTKAMTSFTQTKQGFTGRVVDENGVYALQPQP